FRSRHRPHRSRIQRLLRTRIGRGSGLCRNRRRPPRPRHTVRNRRRRASLRNARTRRSCHQRARTKRGHERSRSGGHPSRSDRQSSPFSSERRVRTPTSRTEQRMRSVLSLTMVAETLRIATPYACAAVGGIWAERSGIIQIGLEAVLLTSAFTSVAVAATSGSAALGLAAGVASGALLSPPHRVLVERARVHAVISGIALNLLAYAGTRLGLRGLFESASNSPSIAGFRFGPTGGSGAAMLARFFLDPVTVLAVAATALTPFVLARTRFRLRARPAGDHPVPAPPVATHA